MTQSSGALLFQHRNESGTAIAAQGHRFSDVFTDWQTGRESFLFFAPHDDDSVISLGMVIREARREGIPVRIVVVTDGQNGYVSLKDKPTIVARRVEETYASYELLGVDRSDIVFLNFPDGGLQNYYGRQVAKPGDPTDDHGFTGLENHFVRELRRRTMINGAPVAPTRIFVPSAADYHQDHVAVALERRTVVHDERRPGQRDPPHGPWLLARDEQHLLVLHVHALRRADARRKVEDLRFAEALRREEPAAPLPDDRRVEALLDGGPDRERRREVEAVDGEVRPVADADLVDRVEEVIGGVPGEDVAQARLDAHPDEREQAAFAPLLVGGELGRPQRRADLRVGIRRVGLAQVHRQVEVGAVRGERGLQDRGVQPRVARIDDDVGLGRLREGDDIGRLAGVDDRRREAGRIVEGLHRVDAQLLADVGEHERLEERAGLGDRRHAGPDTAGTDDENAAHGRDPGGRAGGAGAGETLIVSEGSWDPPKRAPHGGSYGPHERGPS